MNLEQLQYIVEVAKTGSFTKAAQHCHVTLSAISQSISLLESELGITLFTRSRGLGAIPTAEGKMIIRKAHEILLQVKELKEEAQIYSNTLKGELKIASIPGPMHVLIDIIAKFKKDHPKVKIKIYEKAQNEILDDLQHGIIDIGFIALSDLLWEKHADFLFEKLLEVKIVVGVNKNSPLAIEKAITPEQLMHQTLVLYDDERIRNSIIDLCSQYGELNILFISNNTRAIQNAVRQELGVTIKFDYLFTNNIINDQKEIVPIELTIPNLKPISYGWVLRKRKQPSQILKRFIERLQFE
ncbi:LysR family transcriptional regulator [Paenibacillus larvae subsp. pulvifaciens]|uniref:Transcriptional regulator n=1 Tax=Paenibacillus larvae subsp. larvae TaxID=147375 RepID=A0A2L1U0U3_9BACL|nr:LysR family transcriptional regulator [Paenibacillus larvae]AQT83374.1 LysR family transcriptional regulator [Paenibacillus larvae subsp. pulvifaciens]AVF26524.1 transcriptional regulator [Paenibacillus larvae subsp. larvae]MCY7521625.1 LysR family transcriptional regulator [Paenibacillus larvae]MCY9502138.1 LysR family transcriptional regulator [Paenibacillus larvae]MCY9745755.1 LysR family transcriptional regulator [Paenibacillus larvae]